MTVQAVLLPVFVEVAATFVLLFSTGWLRTGHLRRGEVDARDVALGQKGWPPLAQKISNSFENQFQVPVLFYVLTAFALITQQAGLLCVILAWVFVALRLVHLFIHVGPNNLAQRGGIFGIAALVLLAMWIVFAIDILSAPLLP